MTDNTEEVLKGRFEKLFEGLDAEKAKSLFEELIDDYCFQVFGLPVLPEMRKLKRQLKVGSVCIQPLAERAILVSKRGFTVTSQTQHPKGGVQLILKEVTKSEFNSRERH
jgi:hypothetical protein